MAAPPSTPRFHATPAGEQAAQALLNNLRREHQELWGERVTKTEGMKIFALGKNDLEGVDCKRVRLREGWRASQQFEVMVLARICIQKYGSLEGLLAKKNKNKAAAEKRQATQEARAAGEVQAARRAQEEAEGPLVTELRKGLGLVGVKKINQTWANDLLRVTKTNLKKAGIEPEEAPGHFDGYRSQLMYDVKGALDVCIEKYGSLEGLKRHKREHPIDHQKDRYAVYEVKTVYEPPCDAPYGHNGYAYTMGQWR